VIAIAIAHIETVIERLTNDRAFRMKYCQDPDRTLRSYLSPAEIRAIKSGDSYLLGQFGTSVRWQQLTAALCGSDPGP
jgi:hypothetical protein